MYHLLDAHSGAQTMTSAVLSLRLSKSMSFISWSAGGGAQIREPVPHVWVKASVPAEPGCGVAVQKRGSSAVAGLENASTEQAPHRFCASSKTLLSHEGAGANAMQSSDESSAHAHEKCD